MEANLTHDTEFIARMVLPSSLRTPIAKFIWEDKCNVHRLAKVEEKLLIGMTFFTSQSKVIRCSELKFGTMTQSKTIL